MSSTYGERIKLSIFGQSHGPAIGMTLDGVPAGLKVDEEELQAFLQRRAPGNDPFSTTRKETDKPDFLSGIVDGRTCGAPIAAIIKNTNTHSQDYDNLRDCPRPGHADYTAQIKYHGFQDVSGGGHFSGRLTAPLCIAGGLCKQWLAEKGISIAAHIHKIGNITDGPKQLDPVHPDFSWISPQFPTVNPDAAKKMMDAIAEAKADGNSVGGVISCFITGVPAGLGEPMFGGIESKIAQIIFGIPAVKGVEFGSGFTCAEMLGSRHNDAFTIENGTISTKTNNAGGILGGITNAMPIVFRVAIKPTPSITKPQKTVRFSDMQEEELIIHGRHDPCIVPRAVPVIEAAAAIALYDALLMQ